MLHWPLTGIVCVPSTVFDARDRDPRVEREVALAGVRDVAVRETEGRRRVVVRRVERRRGVADLGRLAREVDLLDVRDDLRSAAAGRVGPVVGAAVVRVRPDRQGAGGVRLLRVRDQLAVAGGRTTRAAVHLLGHARVAELERQLQVLQREGLAGDGRERRRPRCGTRRSRASSGWRSAPADRLPAHRCSVYVANGLMHDQPFPAGAAVAGLAATAAAMATTGTSMMRLIHCSDSGARNGPGTVWEQESTPAVPGVLPPRCQASLPTDGRILLHLRNVEVWQVELEQAEPLVARLRGAVVRRRACAG